MATVRPTTPGVFVTERNPQRAQEGISPSIFGIIGFTLKGPVNTPTRVESFTAFERIFGGLTSKGLVPITVREFYENDGQIAIVNRIVPADATRASGVIDTPTRWELEAQHEGAWGNDMVLRVTGNPSFLDVAGEKWDKFDVLVLQPDEFGTLVAAEVFEGVQFTDTDAADYFPRVLNDDVAGSDLVEVTIALGGVPADLLAKTWADEDIGDGDGSTTNFTPTLANPRVLQTTLRIVAAEATIDDEVQSLDTGTIDGANQDFTLTLPNAPLLDASLRLFYAEPLVQNEVASVTGAIDSANQDYTIAAGSLSDAVHREDTNFRIKYAVAAPSSPENLTTIGGSPATHDLSTTPLTDTPVHPGTVVINLDEDGVGAVTITDDGNGNLVGSNGTILPGGGTINYDTGAMTGTTAPLTAASSVDATYNQSEVITKAASSDNLAQGVSLLGDVDGAGTNEIDLVDDVANPTGNGLIDFRTANPPLAGTNIVVDFHPLGLIDGNAAGDLTGDVDGAGTNTVDYTTGAVDVRTVTAPATGTTIDADYQQGQVVTDNGLGALEGDVDPSGANTINYETGEIDVTFATAPVNGTDIFANYTELDEEQDYSFSGGSDGTNVDSSVITDPSLEAKEEGIFAFDKVEEILNVSAPDFMGNETVSQAMVDWADDRLQPGRFIILSADSGLTIDEAIQYFRNDLVRDSKNMAFYWPNIKTRNPLTEAIETIPNVGHVAGVYARTDREKNVGKAPGGVSDGRIANADAVGPEIILTREQRGRLNQNRINAIISTQVEGFTVFGVRTASRERIWRYVNARRLFQFISELGFRQTQFAVFENNGPALWQRITLALTGRLRNLFEAGFFAGQTAEDAFFVRVDDTNNTQQTIEQGLVIVDIGFAPFVPAEFINVRVQQIQRNQV